MQNLTANVVSVRMFDLTKMTEEKRTEARKMVGSEAQA